MFRVFEEFKGKTAIITGGGTGIGRATALRLAELGANVVIASRSEEDGLATVREITEELGGSAAFIQTDVSKEEQIISLVNQTIERFGSIDYMYNNSAITGDNELLEDYKTETFDRVFDVNVRGQQLLMKYAVPHMKPGSAIVNCASLHGTIAMAGDVAYSASKHAVIGLGKSAAAELAAKGIRVNIVAPGPVPTKMMRRYEELLTDDVDALEQAIAQLPVLKRYGTPEEVANAVVFLLSDMASYIVGHVLMVDGGCSIIR
ncbi:SDR family NAD(P)-dependent oxidoreductase [Paenibacillus sp. NPDC057934]|uniref:SDR family NAD(P)-dependent oxidoreductase n=1 Tax=Paenibacillus sp. NPDC057934 TaxID=3346282 RepID=UPI0036D97A68